MPFMLPGRRSLLEQAGYQNPSNGALLEGLISVIWSKESAHGVVWTISFVGNLVKLVVLTGKRCGDYIQKPAETTEF